MRADTLLLETPQQDLESERATLGACLIDAQAIDLVAEIVTPADFYRASHGKLWEAILALHARRAPIDELTLTTELRRTGLLDAIGGPSSVSALTVMLPTSANAAYYASLVRDAAQLRRASAALAQGLQHLSESTDEPSHRLEHVEQIVFSATRVRDAHLEPATMGTLLAQTFTDLDSGVNRGVMTGFVGLDELTNGLRPGDLAIVAARPAMGKSTLALNLALNVAMPPRREAGKHVLFVSLEMASLEIARNMLCTIAGVDSHRLRGARISDDERRNLEDASERLGSYPITIRGCECMGGLTVMRLRGIARRLKAEGKLGLLVVDYIQLLTAADHKGYRSRENEVSEISRELRFLAAELDVPLVALAQLNREVESRNDHRPRMSDLRESGGIEADAALILLLHRESYYDHDKSAETAAELIVAKSRYGISGVSVPLYYERSTGVFHDADRVPARRRMAGVDRVSIAAGESQDDGWEGRE